MTELDDATIKGWVPKHLSVMDVVGAIPSDNGGSKNTYDPNFSLQGVGPAHTADSRFVHQVLNRKKLLGNFEKHGAAITRMGKAKFTSM